jgi:antitoxin MazE
MKASIVQIGNSRGIRIPKAVFEQCQFEDEVDMEVQDRELVIRSVSRIREGWGEAFRAMAEAGDDKLLELAAEPASAWDDAEWEWK